LYSWDLLTPFAYVDPGKTASGTGTLSNPYNPTQGLAIGPAASGDRLIVWLPGGYKYAAIVPTSGASATRRVIHKAQNPGSTVNGLRTRIRRVGGAGSIVGFNGTSYAVWDGFMVDTKTLLSEGGDLAATGEAAQLSAWNSTGCKFIRMYSDHQGANYADSNRSNVYIQYCDDIEIGDCRITNIGPASAVSSNVVLVELYDSTNLEIHNCEIWNGPTGIWSKGQYNKPNGVANHRYHHNVIRECGIGIRVSNPIQTSIANAVRAYQNVIRRCQHSLGVKSYASGEPKGIIFANNTVYNGQQRGAGDHYGTTPFALAYEDETASSFVSGSLIVSRNNAIYNVAEMIFTKGQGGLTQYDNCEWNRNLYNTFTNFWRQGEGGPTATFGTWQGQSPSRDASGLTSTPGFENIASDDIRPASGSALLGAGTDYLDLLGGGTSAAINIGAVILADRSDVFGPRV
jgi:hypothetical protein